jgi:hypothetical protein
MMIKMKKILLLTMVENRIKAKEGMIVGKGRGGLVKWERLGACWFLSWLFCMLSMGD